MILPHREAATESLAAEVWMLYWELFMANKAHMHELSAQFDLSPQQAWALRQLAVDRPLVMSELAEALGCDASNVTSIADRLEARGLVERRSSEQDRRVKALVLTPAGRELENQVWERMCTSAPPPITSLSTADQENLRAILRRALDSIP